MINQSILSIERSLASEVGNISITGTASGVPVGGTTGQILAKQSDNNYDTHWIDQQTSSAEFLLQTVYNGAGTTINKGEAVYIAGAQGTSIIIGKAIGNSTNDSEVIGIALENILNNEYGTIVIHGIINGLNTDSFLEGDRLYLSSTTYGQVTNIEPSAPNAAVLIGYCVKKSVADGSIYVNINVGEHLDALHDVNINSAVSGNYLFFDSDGVWKNKTIEYTDVSGLTSILSGLYPSSNPSGYISGDLSLLYPRSNPSGYITGIDTSNFYTKDNPSGYITGDLSLLYPRSNPSGYISGIQNLVYTTGDQTISGIKTFANNVTVLGDFAVSGTTFINQVIDVTTTGIISGVTGVFQYLEAGNILYSKTDSYVVAKPGDDLVAKYAEATALTPNGSAKSATNRASLIILPGAYAVTSSPLSINTNFVDVIGLGAQTQKPAVFMNPVSLEVSATNVRVNGISVNSSQFVISNSNVSQIFENCIGGNYSFGQNGANGTFVNCVGGNSSFGGPGSANGTFINCIGGTDSFGGNGAGGVFNNCTAGNNSFSWFPMSNAAGTFNNCTAGNSSFAYYGTAGGAFTNCTAGLNSFGADSTLKGLFISCRLTSGTFNTLTAPTSGKALMINCIDGNANIINGQAPL